MHKLTPSQGASLLSSFWELLAPSTLMLETPALKVPSLVEVVERTSLFGHLPSHVRHQLEPDFLGTFRVVTKGSLKLCAFSPA